MSTSLELPESWFTFGNSGQRLVGGLNDLRPVAVTGAPKGKV